jgi:hypothetical protein
VEVEVEVGVHQQPPQQQQQPQPPRVLRKYTGKRSKPHTLVSSSKITADLMEGIQKQ